MTPMRALRCLAIALAFGPFAARGASGGQAMPVSDIEEGVSWTLAERRAGTLSDLRYRYRLRIPRERDRPVAGSVEVRFAWSDSRGRDVVLDFKDPSRRVSAVRANGAPVEWAARHDHVVVPVGALRPDGRNRVELDFEAGDEALNRNDDFLYTLFVPDRAHFSLPLFDQPNLKARFTLTLEAPGGWAAVSNGETAEAPDPARAGERAVWRFAETQPIPTYLFAFAAGKFEIETAERSGRTLRMFHRETDAAKVVRNREAVFDLHAAALDWLEDYTGIPYPFGKFDFVLIPPFQYGGMEHPGSIFYRASSLLLDESATQAAYLGRASLIAHETAHMWFGDLVTMNWFDDVWTKEVFANFLAAKIVHPSFPEVDHDLRFFLAHHHAAYGVDRTAGANPIRQPLDNLNEAGALYGPIIYQKAPIVMQHLERLVGERPFRDGLREYLREFRYGNAAWPDLIDILDRRTETDLRAWSAVWVDEPGRPTVTVRRGSAGGDAPAGRLTLEQSDPAGRARLWPQQIELLLAWDDAEVRTPLLLAAGAASVDLPRPAPRFVLPNAGGVEYGRFRLDAASTGFLMTALPDVEDALTRGIAWGTLWEAVLDGEIPVGDWFELLLRGLAAEPVEQNAQRLLGYLSTTCWSLMDDAARREAAPRVEEVLWAGVMDSAESTRRAAYFRAWRGLVQSPGGVERLRRIWAEEEAVPGVTLSERDFTALSAALAVRGVEETAEILTRQAARIENPDRRARFEFLRPALSADAAVREAFFAGLGEAANREREPWVLAALGYLHHPLRAAHARQFIRPALDLLVEIQRTGDIFFPAGWLDATLGGHNSAAAADVIRRFLDGLEPGYPPRLRAKILQSADLLFRAAGIVEPAAGPGA